MRVIHVLEVSHGGVVTYVRELARAQADGGAEVHVLAPSEAGPFAGRRHKWSPNRRSIRSMVEARRQLAKTIRLVEPDVVHLHSFFPGILGRTTFMRGATVYQPHSWAFGAVPPAARWLVACWERWASSRTHALVVNSASEADEGRAYGIDRQPHVVGLPLDTALFAPRQAARPTDLAGMGSRRLILCVGRVTRQKGQLELARAWEMAPLVDSCLVLVGPGQSAEIESAAPTSFRDSLLFLGPKEDVRPYLWSADVLIVPSRYEGQSVAMAEAMACGVPVVSTDVNGAREAIAPVGLSVAGEVVPIGDMGALIAEAGRRLIDPCLRAEESLAARANASELFDSARVARRVAEAYGAAMVEFGNLKQPRKGAAE